MPINPMALRVLTPPMEPVLSPLEAQARTMALQGTALEQQQKVQALRDQQQLQQILAEHVAQGGDPNDPTPIMGKIMSINPRLGVQMWGQVAKERAAKAKALREEEEFKQKTQELKTKRFQMLAPHLTDILNLPEDQQEAAYAGLVENAERFGITNPGELGPFNREGLRFALKTRPTAEGSLHVLRDVEDPANPGTYGTMVTGKEGFYKGKEGTPSGHNPNKEALAIAAAGGDETAKEALKLLGGAEGGKNPTLASLAMEAAGGDPRKALQLMKTHDLPPAAAKEKPATGAQEKAFGFFNQAKLAEEDIQTVEAQIAQRGLLSRAWDAHVWNALKSKAGRTYSDSAAAFIEGPLRQASGAAIRPDEYEKYTQKYFAVPGDTEADILRKRRLRKGILATLAQQSGPALDTFYGDEADMIRASLKEGAKETAPREVAVGTIKTFPNGKKGRWDGRGWELVVP